MSVNDVRVVAIIQSRMGSTRLPGKAMISLDCTPVIQHVVRRATVAKETDKVVVATTDSAPDDIISRSAKREGAKIFRGDETDVLGRVYSAAVDAEADLVVRLTADNPLVSPEALDVAARSIQDSGVDYVSNKIDRTFPAGLDIEVFTLESFDRVEEEARSPHHREHVTPYYRESDVFSTENLTSEEVFEDTDLQNRIDLRLTLDTPTDYELFRRIYDDIEFDQILDVKEAIHYIDNVGIGGLNRN